MLEKIIREISKPLVGTAIGKSWPVKMGYRILCHFLNPIEVSDGHRIFVDPRDETLGLLTAIDFEKPITELLKKTIKEGDIVLDIGSHIGYHTLTMAKLVGPNGKVYAFEPDPDSFSLLKKNIEINGYKNVLAVQKAVSNKTGSGKLYIGKSKVLNRIYDSRYGKFFINIGTIRLDDFIKEKIALIRMDINGGEGIAFEGMSTVLQNTSKIILEFYPSFIRESGIEPIKILATLNKHGFSLYQIKNGNEELVEDFRQFLRKIDRFPILFCKKSKEH